MDSIDKKTLKNIVAYIKIRRMHLPRIIDGFVKLMQ